MDNRELLTRLHVLHELNQELHLLNMRLRWENILLERQLARMKSPASVVEAGPSRIRRHDQQQRR